MLEWLRDAAAHAATKIDRLDRRLGEIAETTARIRELLAEDEQLCGVTLEGQVRRFSSGGLARIAEDHDDEAPTSEIFGAGDAGLLGPGGTRTYRIAFQVPLAELTVEAWGPCFITDVMVAQSSMTLASEVQMRRVRVTRTIHPGLLVAVRYERFSP